jgi:hypothetical protein
MGCKYSMPIGFPIAPVTPVKQKKSSWVVPSASEEPSFSSDGRPNLRIQIPA